MDDLLSEFLTETNESLGELDNELLRLEQNPNDPDLLSNIFRLVHTIKGTCGFLGLPRLETLAHATENVLGRYREGDISVTPPVVSIILEALDTIKSILGELEQTEAEPEGDDSELIHRLEWVVKNADSGDITEIPADGDDANLGGGGGGGAADADEGEEAEEAEEEDEGELDMEAAMGGGEEAEAEPAPEPEPEPEPEPAPEAKEKKADKGKDKGKGKEEGAPPAPQKSAEGSGGGGEKKPPAQGKGGGGGGGDAGGGGQQKESQVAQQNLRVSVDLLENLMTMVSELVLTRNQLLQILRNYKESEFAAPLQRLSHVTSELQEGVMKTRMQPIGNAWSKLPRIVRDLGQELGKKIDLQMYGAETELDRQVLDLIKDPLTHMVRNSGDHGLESTEERIAKGKPETGHITLNAYHEGGHIIIEIADDGKGLDWEKIAEKAINNELTTEAEVASMTEQQIQQFIFKPGFSTAGSISSVSGRGVGMDVVRNNIEKIGGTIELKSRKDRGTTFIIKIPLTLAIVSALIVECSGERFAIPQISVVELVRSVPGTDTSVEDINGTAVLRLRNRLLPLVSLAEVLQIGTSDAINQEVYIVVAQVGTYSFGIIVDRVFDTEEIVVKPVAPILRHIEMFSGNTILGDGTVIMILDPNGIAAATGEITMAEQELAEKQTSRSERSHEEIALLLFKAGEGPPKAVPLNLVARLEEFELEQIETFNNQPVIQYRGKLMPLVPIDPYFQFKEQGRQPCLVFADGDRAMGLLVDEIVDIVEEALQVELTADREGLMGSAVVAGRATDVIDAGYYLTQAFQDWFAGDDREAYEEEKTYSVLLVDDSPFFRNLLTPLLSVSGYQVTAVSSAEEALNALEDEDAFYDVVVTDVEMPGISGFELAERLRQDHRFKEKPLIALSSHAKPRDLDRGRAAGFTDYVAKFDRDALLQTLNQTLAEQKGAA